MRRIMTPAISSFSSLSTSRATTDHPNACAFSATAGPERSSRVPATVESLMVRIATLITLGTPLVVSRFAAGLLHQIDLLDLDAFVQRLGHIVNRQGCHRRSGQGLHFDAGGSGG